MPPSGSADVDDKSQPDYCSDMKRAARTDVARSHRAEALSEPLLAILSSQTHTATASILRTHSQCQRGPSRPNTSRLHARISCLHLLDCQSLTTPRQSRVVRPSLQLGWPCLPVCAASFACASRRLRSGGAYRDRTDDLMLAKQPLSQLS